jgi:hypothetical protein
MTRKVVLACIAVLLFVVIVIFRWYSINDLNGKKVAAKPNIDTQAAQPSIVFVKLVFSSPSQFVYPIVANGHYLYVPDWANSTNSIVYDGKVVFSGVLDGSIRKYKGEGEPYIAISDNGQHYMYVTIGGDYDFLYIDGKKITEQPILSGGITFPQITDNGQDYFYTNNLENNLFKDGNVVYSAPSGYSIDSYLISNDGSSYIVNMTEPVVGSSWKLNSESVQNGEKTFCKNSDSVPLMSQNGQHIACVLGQGMYYLDGHVVTTSISVFPDENQNLALNEEVTNDGYLLVYGSDSYVLFNMNGFVREASSSGAVMVNDDISRVLVYGLDPTYTRPVTFLNNTEINTPAGYSTIDYSFTGNTLYIYVASDSDFNS